MSFWGNLFNQVPLGKNAKDGYAVVDEQFMYLTKDKWRKTHWGYVIRSRDKVLLHRLITNAPKGLVVDHINGDPLDNRLENLRVCTQAENVRNMKLGILNKSGFKGVFYHKDWGKYTANIKYNYKNYYLGTFERAEDAARAYDIKAKELHGEFARVA